MCQKEPSLLTHHGLIFEEIMSNGKTRESGIEILKIIAMCLIVIYHTDMSVSFMNGGLGIYPLSAGATTDINVFIFNIFGYFGHIGCTIFFVCSAWFLVESEKVNKRKVVFMLSDVWTVSVIVFIVFLIRGLRPSHDEALRALFPNSFAVNWYITCYLLFYIIHPLLNLIIKNISKRTHLAIVAVSVFLYYLWSIILNGDLFFVSKLIMFFVIYFIVSYMKLYMKEFSEDTRVNIILLLIGIAGFLGELFIMNLVGLKNPAMSDQILKFNNDKNFFVLILSIALFNLFRKLKGTNKVINYISSLTLFVYIIHDNTYLAGTVRCYFAAELIKHVPYSLSVPAVVLFGVAVFLCALFVSILYKLIIKRPANFLAEKVYELLRRIYLFFEGKFLLIK